MPTLMYTYYLHINTTIIIIQYTLLMMIIFSMITNYDFVGRLVPTIHIGIKAM